MIICLDQRSGSGCGTENPDDVSVCRRCGRSLRFALQFHEPGKVIGAYQIRRIIGHGGFGAVYEAISSSQTAVALKENFDSSTFKRLKEEFIVLRQLHHDNLPRYNDIFHAGDNCYLVMELIQGQNLEEIARQTGQPLPETQVLGYIALVLLSTIS